MRRILLLTLLVLFITIPNMYAQGLEFGAGFGVAMMGRNIPTFATVDSLGVTHITTTLDEGPQLFLELHYDIPVGSMGIGPVIGVFPKIDLGSVTNLETEQPVSGGVGLMVRLPFNSKQHFNLNFIWAISAPVSQVDGRWLNGYQAPRDSSGLPIQPQFIRQSNNRLMFAFSVSNIF